MTAPGECCHEDMSEGARALRLRPVRANDLDAVAAMQEISIMALGAPLYGEAKAQAWARLGYQFRYDLLGEGGFWVVERDDRLLGVGGWSPDSMEADLAWIRYLFVHPDAVRRGIGRRLVERAERAAWAAERPRLRVWSSLNAVGFYRALGFVPERRARWPVQRAVELDYVLMAKRAERAPPGSSAAANPICPSGLRQGTAPVRLAGRQLLAAKPAMDRAEEQAADDRRHPGQPELAERPATREHRDAGAARRIDRGVGDRGADQVDQRQGEADGERPEAGRGSRIGRAEDHDQEKPGQHISISSAELSG